MGGNDEKVFISFYDMVETTSLIATALSAVNGSGGGAVPLIENTKFNNFEG